MSWWRDVPIHTKNFLVLSREEAKQATWPKHQQEGRMQEKHLEFTQVVEKRWKQCQNTRRNRKQHIYLRKNKKKHVDEFSGNMSNFKKTNICSKERKQKTHIYIYYKQNIFTNKKPYSPKKLYSKKTSLIPQKSEMPKKTKTCYQNTNIPGKIYYPKTWKTTIYHPKNVIFQKIYIPKKNIPPKNYIPKTKVIFPKKKLYSKKKVIFPKKCYIPQKKLYSKKKLYSQKKIIFPKKSYSSRNSGTISNSGKMIGIENQISTRSWAQKPNHYPTRLQFSRVVIWLLKFWVQDLVEIWFSIPIILPELDIVPEFLEQ